MPSRCSWCVCLYVAFAVLPGPRGRPTGAEPLILVGFSAVAAVMGLRVRRRAAYIAGIALVLLAFVNLPTAPVPWLPSGLFAVFFPLGWVLLWSGAWSWKAGVASYAGVGLWTLALLAASEGVMYFSGPLHDADQFVFRVAVPVVMWPQVTFGMLGAFGTVYQ